MIEIVYRKQDCCCISSQLGHRHSVQVNLLVMSHVWFGKKTIVFALE